MRARGVALLLALLATGAAAQPSAIDPARIERVPASVPAVTQTQLRPNMSAIRTATWTFRNDSSEAITSIRLKAEGGTAFGPNLLATPIPPGETRTLSRPVRICDTRVELQFSGGGRQTLPTDLCAEPLLRVREAPLPSGFKTFSFEPEPAPRPPESPAPDSPPPASPSPVAPPTIAPPTIALPPTLPPAMAGAQPAPALPAPPRTAAARPEPARPEPARPALPPSAPNEPAIQPEAPPSRPDSDAVEPAPMVDSAAEEARIYCDALEETVPAAVCDRVRAVNSGVAAVKANPDMVLGETQIVRLVVSKGGDTAAVVQELGGQDAVYRQFGLATGRFMEARLTADSGLDITPTDWIRRDLGAGDLEDWEWNVTATAQGRHRVVLRTRVMQRLDDGSFIARPGRESEPQYVDVKITRSQDIEQRIGLVTRWLNALAAPTESLANLLTLLGSLVAAAGALWLAIRGFGRKDSGSGD